VERGGERHQRTSVKVINFSYGGNNSSRGAEPETMEDPPPSIYIRIRFSEVFINYDNVSWQFV
jgi:hypothetical protein